MENRKDSVRKIAKRFLENLEKMDGYNKLVYMEKIVDMLDEMHLIALDFSVDMTAGLSQDEEKGN